MLLEYLFPFPFRPAVIKKINIKRSATFDANRIHVAYERFAKRGWLA
jgi:hypothetical protein